MVHVKFVESSEPLWPVVENNIGMHTTIDQVY